MVSLMKILNLDSTQVSFTRIGQDEAVFFNNKRFFSCVKPPGNATLECTTLNTFNHKTSFRPSQAIY